MHEIPHREHDTRIAPDKDTPAMAAFVAVGLLFASMVVVGQIGSLAAETTLTAVFVGLIMMAAGSVSLVAIIARLR